MKTLLSGHTLTVIKDEGDKNYYGTVNGKGESNFLYALKEHLNSIGFELIKKRMYKDGHMVDDLQQYLRVKSYKSGSLHIHLYSHFWAIRGLNDDWNEKGIVNLSIDYNIFEKQPNAKELTEKLIN